MAVPGQVRGQDAPGRLSRLRPISGASSWKTGPLRPGVGPLWRQRWVSLSHPYQHASSLRSGTRWFLTWGGGGSSWSETSGAVWGREVWLQPLRGPGGSGEAPGPVWGCSPSSLLRSCPSAPQLPRKGSPLLSDTGLGAGSVGWRWPLSRSLEGRRAFWSVRKTITVSCIDSLFMAARHVGFEFPDWTRDCAHCSAGAESSPLRRWGSPFVAQSFRSPPGWCPSPGIQAPSPYPGHLQT